MRSTIVFSVFIVLSFSGIHAFDCKMSENHFSIREYEFKMEGDHSAIPEECSKNGLIGGVIFWGYDCNSSGVIENWEIENSCYVCYPPNILIKADQKIGESCVREGVYFGGFRFITGKDQNNNGTLDDGEIMHATTICNGYDEEKQKEYENPSFEDIRDIAKESDTPAYYVCKEEGEGQMPSQPAKPKDKSRETIFMALATVPPSEKNKKKNREEKRKEK